MEVTEDVLQNLENQNGELLVIERFDDISQRDGVVEFLVKWKGFSEDGNNWISDQLLREDVSNLFKEYLTDLSKNGTKRQRDIANRLL